ncbi:MAG: hypothetical protein IMW86_07045 [Hydrogenibacillus sp.]|nr:hypothetical protein [Hydrogenibacillus sp.]
MDGERLTRRRAFVPFQPAVRRRREPVKWVLSILSAVVFGALFGYILLWLWIGMDGTFARLPGRTGAPRAPEQGARVVDNGTNAGTQGASNVAPFVGSGMLPSQTFYAIQGGVFNDRASSEPLLKRAESESVPATLVEGEPLRLFYGVTYRLDDATELAAYYVGKGFDVYVRPYALSGGAIQATFDAEDASLIGSFLTHGLYLFDLSGRWTALGLHEPVVIDDASWKAFKETHGRFLEEGNRLKDRLNGAAGKDVETMTTALNQAVMGLVEYIKAPSEAYLLANEQARLDYFKALLAFYEHAVAR